MALIGNAQIATVRIAERRLLEAAAKYGAATLLETFAAILDDAEARSRQAIGRLPNGVYTARDVIDGDGVSDAPIEVEVTVTIGDDSVTVDFGGCPPALAGPINCGRGALQSAVKSVFKAMIAPHEPSNEGWFRPLAVLAPPRTLFTAEKPSPTGWYYEGSVQASELVWKALAGRVGHDTFSAGSYSSLCVIYLSGRTADGTEFIHVEPTHGGWGACNDQDGANAVISLTDGDTYNHSVELLEARFPFRVRRYALNTDGGVGAGRFRGGYGVVREYEILVDGTTLTGSFGRNATAPWAVDGGGPGTLNRLEVVDARSGRTEVYGRLAGRVLDRGDVVRIITGGGGGWGEPRSRPRERIEADLRRALLTPERALHDYGHVTEGAA